MNGYEVVLTQKDNIITFCFNRLADALQFSETCLECGDAGVCVTIREKKGD